MRSSRGFTLIELVIAIAVFVAIALLAAPVLDRAVSRARLDSAVRTIEACAWRARSLAEREDRPVRLIATRRADGSWTLLAEAVAAEELTAREVSEAALGAPADGQLRRREGEREPERAMGGSARTAPVGLGQGVELANRLPTRAGDGVAALEDEDRLRWPTSLGEEEGGRSIVLGTFLPSGSFLSAGPTYVTAGSTDVEVRIGRLTGRVAHGPVREPTRDDAGAGGDDGGDERPVLGLERGGGAAPGAGR